MAPTFTKPTQPNYNIALISSTTRNRLSTNNPVPYIITEADSSNPPQPYLQNNQQVRAYITQSRTQTIYRYFYAITYQTNQRVYQYALRQVVAESHLCGTSTASSAGCGTRGNH